MKPTALPTLFMPGNSNRKIRKTEIKREKVRSAMDLLFGNSNDVKAPHMEQISIEDNKILENPKINKIGDFVKQKVNCATKKDILVDNRNTKSTKSALIGIENEENYIEIVEKPIIIKLLPSLKNQTQLVENIEEAETVMDSNTILNPSEKVTQIETISPHIEKISPHIEKISPHIEKISPHIETISPHIEKVSPHIETTSEIDSLDKEENYTIDENENQGGEMYFNDNPWKVENILDFNFFCCPECTFQSKEQLNFAIHAVENHILSRIFFKTSAGK